MLPVSGKPGILQSMPCITMIDDNRDNGSDSSRSHARYSQPFSNALLSFVAMLLIAESGYISRYAVERDDYFLVVLVLLSFPPFAFGGILFFHVWADLFW
jgi:hypothetical protein